MDQARQLIEAYKTEARRLVEVNEVVTVHARRTDYVELFSSWSVESFGASQLNWLIDRVAKRRPGKFSEIKIKKVLRAYNACCLHIVDEFSRNHILG